MSHFQFQSGAVITMLIYLFSHFKTIIMNNLTVCYPVLLYGACASGWEFEVSVQLLHGTYTMPQLCLLTIVKQQINTDTASKVIDSIW